MCGSARDAQSATICAYDASHAAASMGYQPDALGAFGVYDPADPLNPVWIAP